MTKHPFHSWISLEQPRLGTRVTFATDEFFAAKERIIEPADPVFIEGKYDDHGKWMDGWESRRRRSPGHDACIIRLGVPGVIHGLNVDTSHFTGNFPPQMSVDVCASDDDVPENGWESLVAKQDIKGDSHNFIPVENQGVWTHVRLNIFPDGGVARLRIYGEVRPVKTSNDKAIDLLALHQGGRALSCSDEHYGSMHNLTMPGRGINMGDGWETARRRGPGNDWVILAFGQPGQVQKIEVDTAHFKGNYPDRVSIDGAFFDDHSKARNDSEAWQTLLPISKLEMDAQHFFSEELKEPGTISHVRMSIFPDGGVSRLRIVGQAKKGE